MEELRQMVEDFCNNSRYISNREYELKFIRLTYALMKFIFEELMDSRDVRETNDFYNLISEDLFRLEQHLGQYLRYLNEAEPESD